MKTFQKWLESLQYENGSFLGKQITDRWPINKAMFNMSSPIGRKEYEDALKDYFDMHQRMNQRKLVSEQNVSEPFTITCWRGCDARSLERDTIEVGQGYRVLHGKEAMEGILWFAHSLQGASVDSEDYARHYAKDFLITYPLKATRHYIMKKFNDGDIEYDVPPEIMNQIKISEASRFMIIGGKAYEVPDGWFFTWQVQKHIGCHKPLRILDSMIESV